MPHGSLVDHAGTIDRSDLNTMTHEIEEACEKVDMREW